MIYLFPVAAAYLFFLFLSCCFNRPFIFLIKRYALTLLILRKPRGFLLSFIDAILSIYIKAAL